MLGDRGLVSPELENGSQAERGLLRRAEAGSNITITALLSTYLVRLISGSQSTTDNATLNIGHGSLAGKSGQGSGGKLSGPASAW